MGRDATPKARTTGVIARRVVPIFRNRHGRRPGEPAYDRDGNDDVAPRARGLILSIAVSVYKIGTSDDPWDTAEHEAAITGAGILGGAAGGAPAD